MMKDKRILILGGTGHLGSALIHHLVLVLKVPAQNIRVFYLKDSPQQSLKDIPGLEFMDGNVLNSNDVEKACDSMQIVFHLIGSTTFVPKQKKIQWLINVEGTQNVLNSLKNSSTFEKLCYISTVNALAPLLPSGSIGNLQDCDPYQSEKRIHSFKSSEATLEFIDAVRFSPDDRWVQKLDIGYFDSKLAAEELVLSFSRQHQLNTVVVLPGTMFGPYDDLIGTGMYLISLYQGKMPATMQTGLPLTHIMDVAEGMVRAIEYGTSGEKYIMTGKMEDNRSLKEMATIIVEELRNYFPNKKFKTPQWVIPYRFAYFFAFILERLGTWFKFNPAVNTQSVKAGKYHWYFSHEESEKKIGYIPQRTFRQGVREMIAYYDQNKLFEVKDRYIDRVKK